MNLSEAIRESLKDEFLSFWQQDGFSSEHLMLLTYSTNDFIEFAQCVTSADPDYQNYDGYFEGPEEYNLTISLLGINQFPKERDITQLAASHLSAMQSKNIYDLNCKLEHQLLVNEHYSLDMDIHEVFSHLKEVHGVDDLSPYITGELRKLDPSRAKQEKFSPKIPNDSMFGLAMTYYPFASTSQLPHPILVEKIGFLDRADELLLKCNPSFSEVIKRIDDRVGVMEMDRLINDYTIVELAEVNPDYVPLLSRSLSMVAQAYSSASLYRDLGGTIIEPNEHLLQMMGETDLDVNFPLKLIRFPYSAGYIHFEKPLKYDLIPDTDILGAYFFQEDKIVKNLNDSLLPNLYPSNHLYKDAQKESGLEVGSGVNQIQISVVHRKVDAASTNDGYIFDLSDTLFSFADNDVLESMNIQNWDSAQGVAISMVFKIALYMGTKQARVIEVNERSELEKRLSNLGAKKIKKMEARVARSYNKIVVGPEHSIYAHEKRDLGGRVATHFRRGHWRQQPCGPKLMNVKAVWIHDLIVNQINDEQPAKKQYKVRM